MVIISNLFSSELCEIVLLCFLDVTSKELVCNDTCTLNNFTRKMLGTGVDFILMITVFFSMSLFLLPQTLFILAVELGMCIYFLLSGLVLGKKKCLLASATSS